MCRKRAAEIVYYLDNAKETRILSCYVLENRRNCHYFVKDLRTSSCVPLLSPRPEFLHDCLCEGGVNQRKSRRELQHKAMNAQELWGVFK